MVVTNDKKVLFQLVLVKLAHLLKKILNSKSENPYGNPNVNFFYKIRLLLKSKYIVIYETDMIKKYYFG